MLPYAAGWLLIPREGETEAILGRWVSTGSIRRRIGVILALIAILAVCSATGLLRGGISTGVGLVGIGTIFYGGYLSRGHRPPAAPTDQPPATAPTPPKKPRPARVVVGVALITLGTLGLFYTLTTVTAGFQPEPHHYITVAAAVIGFCAKPKPTTPHPVTAVHRSGAV